MRMRMRRDGGSAKEAKNTPSDRVKNEQRQQQQVDDGVSLAGRSGRGVSQE